MSVDTRVKSFMFYIHFFFLQIKAGSVINFVTVLILCIAMNTFIVPVFDLTNIPEAFLVHARNETVVVSSLVNSTLGYNVTS